MSAAYCYWRKENIWWTLFQSAREREWRREERTPFWPSCAQSLLSFFWSVNNNNTVSSWLYFRSVQVKRCCYITVDPSTTAPSNGALHSGELLHRARRFMSPSLNVRKTKLLCFYVTLFLKTYLQNNIIAWKTFTKQKKSRQACVYIKNIIKQFLHRVKMYCCVTFIQLQLVFKYESKYKIMLSFCYNPAL